MILNNMYVLVTEVAPKQGGQGGQRKVPGDPISIQEH
jgi:hypothetical protein